MKFPFNHHSNPMKFTMKFTKSSLNPNKSPSYPPKSPSFFAFPRLNSVITVVTYAPMVTLLGLVASALEVEMRGDVGFFTVLRLGRGDFRVLFDGKKLVI